MFNKCSEEDENVDLFPLCKLNTCDVTFANCKPKVLKLLQKNTKKTHEGSNCLYQYNTGLRFDINCVPHPPAQTSPGYHCVAGEPGLSRELKLQRHRLNILKQKL